MRRPEPGSFESLLITVSVPISGMWRLSRFPSSEPYWARDAQCRFDDPKGRAPGGATFGVLYAAQDQETAFCESTIHKNAMFRNGAFEVSASELQARSLVAFAHATQADLLLADFTGAGLKALGLNNDISAGDDYTEPQLWAEAVHGARPDLAGICYISRQHNASYCYAIFDRSNLLKDSAAEIPLATMKALCKRFNVRPVT